MTLKLTGVGGCFLEIFLRQLLQVSILGVHRLGPRLLRYAKILLVDLMEWRKALQTISANCLILLYYFPFFLVLSPLFIKRYVFLQDIYPFFTRVVGDTFTTPPEIFIAGDFISRI